jgi:hypothetical protein
VAALAIVALLVIVSLFAGIPTGTHILSGSNATVVSEPKPNYDVQEVMAFAQSYSRLEFEVTAIAQCDANGYGPAYLVNGLSSTGYWYQVGLSWDWPLQTSGHISGFSFISEAWAPGGLTPSSASTSFSGAVNSNDTVELSLSFHGDAVVASAWDLNTRASASANYPAHGATSFVGSGAQQSRSGFSHSTQGYFTGLMTEWYHASPNFTGPEQKVTYFGTTPITSAALDVTEWNLTTSVPVPVFSSAANDGNPIDFSIQPNQLQQFTLDGTFMQIQRSTPDGIFTQLLQSVRNGAIIQIEQSTPNGTRIIQINPHQLPINGSVYPSEQFPINDSFTQLLQSSLNGSFTLYVNAPFARGSCTDTSFLGYCATIQQVTLPFVLSADAYEYVTGP